jgi:hypothetical protein
MQPSEYYRDERDDDVTQSEEQNMEEWKEWADRVFTDEKDQ